MSLCMDPLTNLIASKENLQKYFRESMLLNLLFMIPPTPINDLQTH